MPDATCLLQAYHLCLNIVMALLEKRLHVDVKDNWER
jgi:hypothetical protein